MSDMKQGARRPIWRRFGVLLRRRAQMGTAGADDRNAMTGFPKRRGAANRNRRPRPARPALTDRRGRFKVPRGWNYNYWDRELAEKLGKKYYNIHRWLGRHKQVIYAHNFGPPYEVTQNEMGYRNPTCQSGFIGKFEEALTVADRWKRIWEKTGNYYEMIAIVRRTDRNAKLKNTDIGWM